MVRMGQYTRLSCAAQFIQSLRLALHHQGVTVVLDETWEEVKKEINGAKSDWLDELGDDSGWGTLFRKCLWRKFDRVSPAVDTALVKFAFNKHTQSSISACNLPCGVLDCTLLHQLAEQCVGTTQPQGGHAPVRTHTGIVLRLTWY